jgi:hypothetical protein
VISKLQNVKSVQEARIIKLKEKVRMEKMELNWTEDAKRYVEDMEVLGELVPPFKLEIDGYNSVRFPEWFDGIASHLPRLVDISLSNLSMCSSLPPLGQLPNLRCLVLERMNSILKIAGTCAAPEGYRFLCWSVLPCVKWKTSKCGTLHIFVMRVE